MKLTVGDKAPSFSLPDQNGHIHSLANYEGKWVLLYFYPKDHTPGCTMEACALRDNFGRFKKLDTIILGVSADSVERHFSFASKHELPFPILSDPEKGMLKEYGAWGKKNFLGKKYIGIRRMSFLINPKGEIAKVYKKVNTLTHASDVLHDLKTFMRA